MSDYLCKKKHLIIYFIIGCILTLPYILQPHYDFDAYQLFNIGYDNYANIFMLSGRVITAIFYYIFNFIQIPYDLLAIISVIGGNIFLALSCDKFEKILIHIKPLKKSDSLLYVLAITFMFFNFFMMEYFTFMESFIMCMAVYLFMLSINSFLKDTRIGYVKALGYALIAMFCYQGAICIYIPLLAFFVYLQNQDKKFKTLLVEFLKKGIYATIIYGICYVTAFLIMKGYMMVSGQVSLKDGSIDIFENLLNFRPMLSEAWKQMFGYFKPVYFYTALILCILANAWKAFTQKHLLAFIIMLFILVLCYVVPFIPNIFLPVNANYVSPRVMIAVPMSIGLIVLFYLCAYPKENLYLKNFIIVLLIILNCLNLLNYHTMMNDGNAKYELDKEVVDEIYNRIAEYENLSEKTITKIAYAQDDSITYFYDLPTKNSFTYRLFAFPWAFEQAVNSFSTDHKYQFKMLTDSEKITSFGENANYGDFDDKQFIFDNDTLYLLLY